MDNATHEPLTKRQSPSLGGAEESMTRSNTKQRLRWVDYWRCMHTIPQLRLESPHIDIMRSGFSLHILGSTMALPAGSNLSNSGGTKSTTLHSVSNVGDERKCTHPAQGALRRAVAFNDIPISDNSAVTICCFVFLVRIGFRIAAQARPCLFVFVD